MNLFAWVRVVHVVSVILWIGGVSFVTSILLSPATSFESLDQRLKIFALVERRFVWQARLMVLLAGGSGLWMMRILGGWHWLVQPSFWWLHLMLFTWTVFTVFLFVVEPLGHGRMKALVQRDPEVAWRRLRIMHVILWILLLVTVICAVAGSHGAF
ncbi:MAG TPA: hypothetical protein VND43_04655 [Burkholderiales bacterium]|nr:hypothetical protein [Burkholderiales bacterium]